MTVYADVLVALNILLTYILLVSCRVFLKIPTNKFAVGAASFIGGFSALVIFLDEMNVAFSLLFKILTAAVISAVAFLPKNIRAFLKGFLTFFAVTFLFGGAMYALEITVNPQNIMYFNGTVYFDMSITYLVGSVLVIYGIFLFADYIIGKKVKTGNKCDLEIIFRSVSVKTQGLIDTGNSLTDGVSGRPVIVAELSCVAPLFDFAELTFLKNDFNGEVPESLRKKFRLIPCKSVTGDSLLKAFIPEEVKITTEKGSFRTEFCAVAITEKDLSGGVYKALLNENIFENLQKEKDINVTFSGKT